MLNPSTRSHKKSFAKRSRGPVVLALLVSGFWVALASASEPDMLVTNASFESTGRLQVAYSLAYSEDAGATCVASPASPVTVTISTGGSLRAEPSVLEFDACDEHQNVVFTADSGGSHDVLAEITSGPAEGLLVSPGLIYMTGFDGPARPAAVAAANSGDTTAPQWACDPPGADDAWHGDNITLACRAWDTESGLSLWTPAFFTLATSAAETEETSDADTGMEILCDVAGNCTLAGNLRGFNVDIRGPERIRIDGPISESDSFIWGRVPPNLHACTAADFGSGMSHCTIDGYSTDIGTHALFAVATDRMGNSDYKNLFYRVEPWTLSLGGGFTTEPARARRVAVGSDVEIPFEIFAGPQGTDEQRDPSVVSAISRRLVSCEHGFPISGSLPLDLVALSRDSESDRFLLTWRAPASGGCHDLSIDVIDGDRRTVRVKVGG
ncbi:MAG: hypothetical protein ACKOFT_02060 [Actinomycetota bacterium]